MQNENDFSRRCVFRAHWIAAALLLVIAVCTTALAGAAPRKNAAVFHELRFDFGKSVQGSVIEHDFVLTNAGTAPLRIARIAMTPPLLATRIPGEIAPGATAAIRTRLDTARLQGSYAGELVVHALDQDAPLATLAFEGLVVTPIEIAPMPAFFVVGDRGRGAERALDIINHEGQPLRIEQVAHTTDVFATRLQTVQPGQHYRLILSLRADGPGGKRTDTITLKTSSRSTPLVRIPANTFLRERVHVFPDAVDMGALRRPAIDARPDLLESTRQTLMIYQTGGRDFQITADSDSPMLKLRTERGPKKDRYQITVEFSAAQIRTGPVRSAIRIHTNDPQFSEIVVPVTGAILER